MTREKKIVSIAAACIMTMILCIGTTSAFASNNDAFKKNAAANRITSKAQIPEADVKIVQTHDDLVKIAAKFGINTAGMTDEQIEAALAAHKQSHQENTKPDGLPPHDHLVAIAAELGINTDGMTDEQIEAALVSYKQSHRNEASAKEDLQLIAKKIGITTTGMSDNQIKDAIKEKGKIVIEEPTRGDLEAAARTMGIDPTGMTDKQLGIAIKIAK